MISIKSTFSAAADRYDFSDFWLLVFLILLLDDARRRDKRPDWQAQPPQRPSKPPRP